MGLLYGENCMILTSTVFDWSTRVTDRQRDRRNCDSICALTACCRAQKCFAYLFIVAIQGVNRSSGIRTYIYLGKFSSCDWSYEEWRDLSEYREFSWLRWVLDTLLKVALCMLTLAKICRFRTEKQVKSWKCFRRRFHLALGTPNLTLVLLSQYCILNYSASRRRLQWVWGLEEPLQFLVCVVVWLLQWATSSRMVDRRLDIVNWRLIDDHELYWLDELAQTSTREVQQTELSEAVKRYLKEEEEQCLKRLASKNVNSSSRLPACPCISSDLRTYLSQACSQRGRVALPQSPWSTKIYGISFKSNYCIGLPIHCNYQLAHYSGFCRISPSILNRFKPNLQA